MNTVKAYTLAIGYGIIAMFLLWGLGFAIAFTGGALVTYGLLIFRYRWGKPIK